MFGLGKAAMLQGKLDHMRHLYNEANEVAGRHFNALLEEQKKARFYREAYDRTSRQRDSMVEECRQLRARLADLQAQQRDAGAQAFARIKFDCLNDFDFAALEQRVAALIAPYGATQGSVRKVAHSLESTQRQVERMTARSAALGWPYGKAAQPQREVKYEGHAGDGGIQGHSIGEEYPFVVYGQQFAGVVKYRVLDTRTGGVYWAKLSSSKSASNFVARLKRENRYVQTDGRLS